MFPNFLPKSDRRSRVVFVTFVLVTSPNLGLLHGYSVYASRRS
jgi:hypothetical protein